jgi:hypothetical protein
MQYCWASSDGQEDLYLEIKINDQIGVLASRSSGEVEFTFCSLFEDSIGVFYEGRNPAGSRITRAQLTEVIDLATRLFDERFGPVALPL